MWYALPSFLPPPPRGGISLVKSFGLGSRTEIFRARVVFRAWACVGSSSAVPFAFVSGTVHSMVS